MTDKQGWLIERYFNGRLHYWNGRPANSNWLGKSNATNLDDGAWTEKPEDAIWFADEASAFGVLSWALGTVGRVAQHIALARSQGQQNEGAES